ncbi:hypothetical protein GTO27_02970 [Candidatus Bathyarchaeota archaeon]|nr:hypothetical protein [Candidatus Bathyarchaeota archaeon]
MARTEVNASTIVMLAVGFLLVAILTPIGMTEVIGANTTGWAASVKTIFTVLLPILYIIGIALYYIPRGK